MKNQLKHPEKPCPYLSGTCHCDYGRWIKKPKCHRLKDIYNCPKYKAFKQRIDKYQQIENNAPKKVTGVFSKVLGKWI